MQGSAVSRRCTWRVCKPSEQGHCSAHLNTPTDRDQHYLLTGWQCGGVLLVTLDHPAHGGGGGLIEPNRLWQSFLYLHMSLSLCSSLAI